MNLRHLLKGLPIPGAVPEIEITGVTCNSAKVKPGYIFVCIPGTKTDGHLFVNQALENGASVIVCRQPVPVGDMVPVYRLPEVRRVYAILCAAFYGHPSNKLNLSAVTGTNGKTTTVIFLDSILRKWGKTTGTISTVWVKYSDSLIDSIMTTPDPEELQKILAEMVSIGIEECIMEASSHALAQERLACCRVHTAIFTNLTRDHLDYHKNHYEYFRSKLKLFEMCEGFGIYNADDPWGIKIKKEIPGSYLSYGLGIHWEKPDVRGLLQKMDGNSSLFDLYYTGGGSRINLRVPGLCNVYNALAAAAAALSRDIPLHIIKEGLEAVTKLPGRFERVEAPVPFNIFIDFAHNPSGLAEVLSTLRPRKGNKCILVFGCKGEDTDGKKRYLMGETAARWADYIIITTDNVYEDDPEEIAFQIEKGIRGVSAGKPYTIILERKEAIKHAIELAEPGDTVIIAGKGHEKSQVVGERKIPFNDRQVLMEILNQRAKSPVLT